MTDTGLRVRKTAPEPAPPTPAAGGVYETRWRARADALACFRDEHHRWPSSQSADGYEHKLGQWLCAQRHAAHTDRRDRRRWTPERAGYLDAVALGWDDAGEARWYEQAAALAGFRIAHGRWPSSGRSRGTRERRLAWWRERQRRLRDPAADPRGVERAACLDRIAPGWDDRLAPLRRQWRERADALAAFRRAHGRWPGKATADPEERSLNLWLNKQRREARLDDRRFTVQHAAYLSDVAPGWDDPAAVLESVWREHADAVVAFRRAHGRWPSKTAPAAAERLLGTWLNNQRQASRRPGGRAWTFERKSYLNRVAPGWDTPTRVRG